LSNAAISPGDLEALEGLWNEVLGIKAADPDATFAELGGTSLLANQLVAQLKLRLGLQVPVLRIFEYPTLRQFKTFLIAGPRPPRVTQSVPSHAAWSAARTAASETGVDPTRGRHDIAVIGMACRFPGARNLDEFWQNLLDGKDTITELKEDQLSPEVPPALRSDPRYVKAAGLIDEPYAMDAAFFDINPMEAKLVDPQHRVLLELSWHALEHAGVPLGKASQRTGVFAGVEDNSYYRAEIMPYPEAEARSGRFLVMTGNEKDYVAMRIAHKLDLRGPAVSVHTACSTSLVAVIMAAKSLRAGECDLALAGGGSVHFPTPEGYYFQEGGVFSSDGHCRPFDASAEGTIFTDGAGMVVLKRLEDAIRDRDNVFAVIRGGAINNDGADKIAFSAPSISGQASCIAEAIGDAGVDPGSLQYVEAHGTATPVGDPIELEGLRRAFGPHLGKRQFCGLGSVKSNIGHTTAAAGVASLIKTAMALKSGVIPASLHFKNPNPQLDLDNSPFYVVDRKMEWPTGRHPRRAGISSFGIGGTNSHVILEEGPERPPLPAPAPRPLELLPVSSRTPSQRDGLLRGIGTEAASTRDLAWTLQAGRARLRYRGARVRLPGLGADDLLVTGTHTALDTPSLVFMFPGQGSQYIQMGMGLYAHLPEFKARFDECCALLSREMALDFKAFIFNPANQETLENTRFTQPALFAMGVSLGRVLIDWGIVPDLLIGHSIGEFAAAHLAGVFSLEDGVRLIAARGRLMTSLPRGRMLSVRGPMDAVLAAAGEPIDLASVNSPVHCVLAGENALIERVMPRLEAAGFPCRLLHTSHAFHSRMMDPVVQPFLEVVRSVALSPPRMKIISTVRAAPLTEAEATRPEYWAAHLRETVRFSPALAQCLASRGNVFVEVGPRATLSALATQHFPKDAAPGAQPVSMSLLSDQPDPVTELGAFGSALARMWTSGYELPWEAIWGQGHRVPLNALHPFERKVFRYSEGRPRPHAAAAPPAVASLLLQPLPLAAVVVAAGSSLPSVGGASSEELLLEQLGTLFSEFAGLPITTQSDLTFVQAGFDSLVLMQIGVALGKQYGVSVSLKELMGKLNTLRAVTAHVLANAPKDKLPKPAAPAPGLAAAGVPALASALAQAPGTAASGELLQIIQGQLQQLAQMSEVLMLQMRLLTGPATLAAQPAAVAPPAPPSAPTLVAVPPLPAPTATAPRPTPQVPASAPARKLIRARYANPAGET
jgi:acyl transferase domain-containing protein